MKTHAISPTDESNLTPQDIEALFTHADGKFRFARWERPIVPVIFGVHEQSLPILKGAIEAVVTLAGHEMADTDPELGANFMVFFMKDWQEMADTPKLGELVPDLPNVVGRLQSAEANQYRFFRFEEDGAIQACFVFLRMDEQLAEQSADALALSQMVHAILLWSKQAFSDQSPLATLGDEGTTVLRPEIADVIRAAYDPAMPAVSDDPTHALRLFARIGAGA